MDTDQAPAVETEVVETPVPETSGKDQIAEAVKNTYTIPEGLSEHAVGVLKGMDPADMAKFAPYVSKWDSGVTKLVQGVHEKYAPFKDLNAEEVNYALEISQLISSSPQQAIDLIKEIYGAQIGSEPGKPTAEPVAEVNEIEHLPEPLKQVLDTVPKLQELVQELVNKELRLTEAAQQAEELRIYNAKLDDLGLKDNTSARNWVTRAVIAGASPEDATVEWNAAIADEVKKQLSAHNNAPNVLSGKSTVPVEGFDVTKLTSRETKNYVTKWLEDSRKNQ